MKKDKVYQSFACALRQIEPEDCKIYSNHERQWGLSFVVDNVKYQGVVHKYKYVDIPRTGWKRLFGKTKGVEILNPSLYISISGGFYFTCDVEETFIISSFREFFEAALKAIRRKNKMGEILREREKEEFLNRLAKCE